MIQDYPDSMVITGFQSYTEFYHTCDFPRFMTCMSKRVVILNKHPFSEFRNHDSYATVYMKCAMHCDIISMYVAHDLWINTAVIMRMFEWFHHAKLLKTLQAALHWRSEQIPVLHVFLSSIGNFHLNIKHGRIEIVPSKAKQCLSSITTTTVYLRA